MGAYSGGSPSPTGGSDLDSTEPWLRSWGGATDAVKGPAKGPSPPRPKGGDWAAASALISSQSRESDLGPHRPIENQRPRLAVESQKPRSAAAAGASAFYWHPSGSACLDYRPHADAGNDRRGGHVRRTAQGSRGFHPLRRAPTSVMRALLVPLLVLVNARLKTPAVAGRGLRVGGATSACLAGSRPAPGGVCHRRRRSTGRAPPVPQLARSCACHRRAGTRPRSPDCALRVSLRP